MRTALYKIKKYDKLNVDRDFLKRKLKLIFLICKK